MKFKKLAIHNIASIEDATLDFEAHPLAGSEVFLITGKTGAGKSTILDAICLALYGNTPRLMDAGASGGLVKDLVNGDEDKNKLYIDSTCQLLRRNQVEGYATLTFMGNNGIEYEARWMVSRAWKKPDGKLKVVRTLKRLDTEEELMNTAKDSVVKDAAVGLTFEQFCRTTMPALWLPPSQIRVSSFLYWY